MSAVAFLALLLVVAPLLPAVAARTTALVTGRRGAPLLQPYRDLGRLFRKGLVYGEVTTWIFRTAPVLWALSAIGAAALLPLDGHGAHLPAATRSPGRRDARGFQSGRNRDCVAAALPRARVQLDGSRGDADRRPDAFRE